MMHVLDVHEFCVDRTMIRIEVNQVDSGIQNCTRGFDKTLFNVLRQLTSMKCM